MPIRLNNRLEEDEHNINDFSKVKEEEDTNDFGSVRTKTADSNVGVSIFINSETPGKTPKPNNDKSFTESTSDSSPLTGKNDFLNTTQPHTSKVESARLSHLHWKSKENFSTLDTNEGSWEVPTGSSIRLVNTTSRPDKSLNERGRYVPRAPRSFAPTESYTEWSSTQKSYANLNERGFYVPRAPRSFAPTESYTEWSSTQTSYDELAADSEGVYYTSHPTLITTQFITTQVTQEFSEENSNEATKYVSDSIQYSPSPTTTSSTQRSFYEQWGTYRPTSSYTAWPTYSISYDNSENERYWETYRPTPSYTAWPTYSISSDNSENDGYFYGTFSPTPHMTNFATSQTTQKYTQSITDSMQRSKELTRGFSDIPLKPINYERTDYPTPFYSWWPTTSPWPTFSESSTETAYTEPIISSMPSSSLSQIPTLLTIQPTPKRVIENESTSPTQKISASPQESPTVMVVALTTDKPSSILSGSQTLSPSVNREKINQNGDIQIIPKIPNMPTFSKDKTSMPSVSIITSWNRTCHNAMGREDRDMEGDNDSFDFAAQDIIDTEVMFTYKVESREEITRNFLVELEQVILDTMAETVLECFLKIPFVALRDSSFYLLEESMMGIRFPHEGKDFNLSPCKPVAQHSASCSIVSTMVIFTSFGLINEQGKFDAMHSVKRQMEDGTYITSVIPSLTSIEFLGPVLDEPETTITNPPANEDSSSWTISFDSPDWTLTALGLLVIVSLFAALLVTVILCKARYRSKKNVSTCTPESYERIRQRSYNSEIIC